jgi:hypothetical protein
MNATPKIKAFASSSISGPIMRIETLKHVEDHLKQVVTMQ